ncbi:30S ribosomal protein S2 [Candidatus Woesebacteria bacterium RIFCSPHIGHO2_01_FULL_39_17]|uniref:Small ribosomal subunit protein uS2 n=3 Tax=Candidatus Woeseibacteriota TaxID=1752722 RepID=A0A0G0RJH0_9BACT|nr:MAG: 30S ribosomal protein S2 [Microgenomates group bacterium GW2011_GWC1_38_12]KKQ93987.1 MAG: 30S ribosomal protein S2 [Candidatus Woesebacteria bacterium GW2011_GWB1_39_10b]KKR13777.1 MAG: 30S ribosomal protein S2 [Candidatus Woesebacteria bacterium GW2011_GWA1_39_21b]OGM23382.1 MAG: 30S ribosomal protein S2 [Candidatus Woesebacteria bacterium RIFCSPHIGHO2_01_FULL_39_17]OGM65146.1 MAG: 30S ribosomal protein S2 [Candidatus Woesebacteria bacterium RIFCSPLOWO2_01_FULL_39_14]
MATKVSLKELISAGAHFGHQVKRWNPKMAPFIYGEKDGVHIFDLIKTKEKLEEALELLKLASKEGKSILFVGTKKQVKSKIAEVAKDTGAFYVNERWLGGTLTNFDQLLKSVKKLQELKSTMEAGGFKDRTKKERLLIDREIQRLSKFFGGLTGMSKIPDILVVIDIKREKTALSEANAKGVEVVALVDSNCDPTQVDYPISMNDDATRALEYVLGLMGEAILEGKGIKSSKSTTSTTDKNSAKSVKKPV